MNVDAAATSNPGELSMRGLCRDNCGYWIFGFTSRLEMGTILKAELHAIHMDLKLAWDHGCRWIVIELDFTIVV
ncbi:Ribonuclease H domain - like 10 [Theobroma cacao]|nr:Ribonuclease H domain - like 10 [Theobroma cacao]